MKNALYRGSQTKVTILRFPIFQSLKVPVQTMHGAVLYCSNIHTYWDGLRKYVVLLA